MIFTNKVIHIFQGVNLLLVSTVDVIDIGDRTLLHDQTKDLD